MSGLADGYAISLNTAATGEPVTLDEAKAAARIFGTQDDDYVTGVLIPTARETVETDTRRQLMKATWDVKVPCWWGLEILELPRPPLLSLTVLYQDEDNAQQTLATSVYGVHLTAPDSPFGGIYLKTGQSWPALYGDPNALEVTIRCVCGYSSSSDLAAQRAAVAPTARQAVLFVIADLNENREIGGVGAARIAENPVYRSLVRQLAVPVLDYSHLQEAA